MFNERPIGETVQPCPLQQRDDPVHWIEIELVGEDDKPIPWKEYLVLLPDGTSATGYLDSQGFARLQGIGAAGNCKVSFPQLDMSAWKLIQTLPAKSDQT